MEPCFWRNYLVKVSITCNSDLTQEQIDAFIAALLASGDDGNPGGIGGGGGGGDNGGGGGGIGIGGPGGPIGGGFIPSFP